MSIGFFVHTKVRSPSNNIQCMQKRRFSEDKDTELLIPKTKNSNSVLVSNPVKYAIFGLGNPGSSYKHTRHNVGFQCIDRFAQSFGISLHDAKHLCYYNTFQVDGKEVTIAQPQTFMNLSGRAVKNLSDHLKIPSQNIMVVYDDIDLPLGTLRIRDAGTGGGQRGITNVIKVMGENIKFTRIRVGIGRPSGKQSIEEYVLSSFQDGEMELHLKTLNRVSKCLQVIVANGVVQAMNKFNKSAEQFEKEEQDIETTRESKRSKIVNTSEIFTAGKSLEKT